MPQARRVTSLAIAVVSVVASGGVLAAQADMKPVNDLPEVYVQGIVRDRGDHWSVTVFLVNGQEEPKKLRDQAWLFQPELSVRCPKERPIFFRRAVPLDPGKLDPVTFEEDQQMAMLYRHCVEFAGQDRAARADALEAWRIELVGVEHAAERGQCVRVRRQAVDQVHQGRIAGVAARLGVRTVRERRLQQQVVHGVPPDLFADEAPLVGGK